MNPWTVGLTSKKFRIVLITMVWALAAPSLPHPPPEAVQLGIVGLAAALVGLQGTVDTMNAKMGR